MKKLFALILTIALALTASSALAAGLEGKTIGFINAGPDDYYAAFGDALVVLAKANGAEVIELNSNYSSETELANCQDLIVKGVDAIAVITAGAAGSAATIKAAKFTMSNLVPVVGGVISDTAETLLAGAGVLRNAAGVFGMLAVVGICLVPFLNLGVHYLMYKCTAALAATASGNGRVTGLIEAIGTAFGLIMAMTGSCGVLLIVAMVSAVSTVAG